MESLAYNLEDLLENLGDVSTMSAGYQFGNALGNIIRLAFAVISIIGMWKMFDKAGEHGWGAIIPYYNRYLLFKISDIKNIFWAWLAISIVGSFCVIVFIFTLIAAIVSGLSDGDYESLLVTCGLSLLVLGILCLASLAIRIVLGIKIAGVFNLGGGWAVGLILLPAIFYLIIGMSDNIHYKNRIPMQGMPGQPPYGQQPYGQQPYGQAPYGQNQYVQNPAGASQNPYGQNPAGAPQNPYGQNPYQSPYQQNVSGQNPYHQNGSAQVPYGQQDNGDQQNPYN